MRTPNTIIAHPDTKDKVEAIKAFFKALKIKYEISSGTEEQYDPEFVKKILKGDQDIKDDKGTKLDDLDDLWK